jgi:calcineurin-like phosphoesterase family protein
MSACTYFIGCPHFGHEAMYRFLRADGTRVRPWASAAEGDAIMAAKWNNTVSKGDKVYVMGDVAFTPKDLKILGYLNGTKILIKGNHDTLQLSQYAKYFKDVRAYHKLDNEILSHIPIHPVSLWRAKRNASWLNIHAHLHAEEVMLAEGVTDLRYFSCCVERIGYTPISIDEIRNRVAALHHKESNV